MRHWGNKGSERKELANPARHSSFNLRSSGPTACTAIRVGTERVERRYDVFRDGERFVTIAPHEGGTAASASIHVVLNWFADFRDREQE